MSDIEERLQSLRSRQQEAVRRKAQAEAKLDSVRARKEQILGQLSEEGFQSPEAAREEVQNLSDQVEEVLREIEEKVQGL